MPQRIEAETFGALLRAHRIERGLTQEALAELAGLSRRGIADLERGARRAPYAHTIDRLAAALGLCDADRVALVEVGRHPRSSAPKHPVLMAEASASADVTGHHHGVVGRDAAGNRALRGESGVVLEEDVKEDVDARTRMRRRPVQLPAPVSSFIGRERALGDLRRLLATTRLLTLTGPGGVGKTRLAVQAAAEAAATFPDGVVFVSLGQITDPQLVGSTLCRALAISESADRPLRAVLHEQLGDKSMLIVFDNFEQVVAAAPLLAELLEGCPHLTFMVTSREPLRLRGELEFRVEPLELPDAKRLPSPAELAGYAAIQLFVDRARDLGPNFSLTEANAATISAICACVDGLPLAIELVVARLRLLSLPDLLARLDQRLPVLVGGQRDLPMRQQTLRNTIAWSNDLLSGDEQQLLRRLAVFVGGCRLEAAQVVAATGDSRLNVLEGLESLLAKNLLRRIEDVDGVPRLTMLETIHEFAVDQLERDGEAETVRRAHAMYMLRLAEDAKPRLTSSEQRVWLDRLETEHANLRIALRWLIAQGESDPALRLAGALSWFWWLRGHWVEGARWLEEVLAASTGVALELRAQVLAGAGMLAHYLGDYGRAAALCGDSLALARRLGDRATIAAALDGLGLVARSGGNLPAAQAMFEESLAIYRQLGNRWGTANALLRLVVIPLWAGEAVVNRPQLLESLALFRAVGDRHGAASTLLALLSEARASGEYERARSFGTEALANFRELGLRREVAKTEFFLGGVAVDGGDLAAASRWLVEGLVLADEIGERYYSAVCLDELAVVLAEQGKATSAARLLGAAEAVWDAVRAVRSPALQPRFDKTVTTVRSQLSEQIFASAWAQGRRMTPRQALVSVQQETTVRPPGGDALPVLRTSGSSLPPAEAPTGERLTAREVQVLSLVATGLTNSQVAHELHISPVTVNAHLRSIYAKLGVANRAAATRMAVAHRLV